MKIALILTLLSALTMAGAMTHRNLVSGVPASERASTQPSLAFDRDSGEPTTSSKDNSLFYSVRPDMRKCASPMCGGYFVKSVNTNSTRCANRDYSAECYVTGIDWNGQAEVELQKALLRGKIVRKVDPKFGALGLFRVTEVWQAASDNRPSGTFFRVSDLHVRCVAAPCLTQQESRLNGTAQQRIAGLDLSGAGASDELTGEALAAMQHGGGLIVAGDHTTVTGPAGRSESLKATQFYLPAKKSGDESASRKPCKKEGCSGQVCSDHPVITNCEWRPVYECYQKAVCERQANGDCGFTKTPELTACLSRF